VKLHIRTLTRPPSVTRGRFHMKIYIPSIRSFCLTVMEIMNKNVIASPANRPVETDLFEGKQFISSSQNFLLYLHARAHTIGVVIGLI
jgi:hypothetical protein